jgi:DNA-binding transcriptional LysR family regulator
MLVFCFTSYKKGWFDMIDYRYKTFSVLADLLNYTKTAEFLNLSQPAVTKHIQYLENHLETHLVQYENRKLTLTKEGHYLKREIDKVDQETSLIKAKLAKEKIKTSLLVGASHTIGGYCLADKLQKFTLTEKNAEIDLVIDNTKNILHLLDQGKIDIALISGPFNSKLYNTQLIFEDTIVAICSPDNPMANLKEAMFSDLKSERLLLREKDAGISGALKEALLENDLSLNQFSERTTIGNIHLIKDLVKKDEGISFLYNISVADDIAEKSLSSIYLTDFSSTQSFYLVWNKTKRPNKLRDKFARLF